jgi:hypothetical protein
MQAPHFARPPIDAELWALAAGPRSADAFVRRRCQTVLVRARSARAVAGGSCYRNRGRGATTTGREMSTGWGRPDATNPAPVRRRSFPPLGAILRAVLLPGQRGSRSILAGRFSQSARKLNAKLWRWRDKPHLGNHRVVGYREPYPPSGAFPIGQILTTELGLCSDDRGT